MLGIVAGTIQQFKTAQQVSDNQELAAAVSPYLFGILIVLVVIIFFLMFLRIRFKWALLHSLRITLLIFSKIIHSVLKGEEPKYSQDELYDNMWDINKIIYHFWVWDYRKLMYNKEMLEYAESVPIHLLSDIIELTYDKLHDNEFTDQFRKRIKEGYYLVDEETIIN